MANKLAALLDAKEAARPQGQPYGLSTAVAAPELPERAGALPQRLQDIALAYISARQRAGDSLLEMARWMSEARAVAIRGEWYVFLEAISTSTNNAESLLAIHARAMNDPVFAAAMRRNFLSLSAGYELLSAPAEVQDRLLQSEQPITRKQIREEKEATKPHAGVGYGTAQAPLPAMPPATSASERETDLPPEYDIVKRRLAAHGYALLSNMQGHHRAYVTRKEGMTGVVTFDWADVLSKLERLEAEEDTQNPNYSDDDDPPVGIAHAGRVFAEHGYATRLGSDDLWEVWHEGKVTKVLTRAQMIAHADALTFLADRRAVLARYDRHAMVSQADYYQALEQIAAIVE